ncbi:hypothetical protein TNCV_3066781 [Trichonephila clavipes]|nr:hypothetical protein TNCV_3066781 [Trichonephila clavipes]
MARKKQKNTIERHRNSNATPSTSHEGSKSTATPEPSYDDVMDLSLPASPQVSRLETPQDFDATSSNCLNLLCAAAEIRAFSTSMKFITSQINDLMLQGLTDPDNPAILEKSKILERLNGYYQQVVRNFPSLTPM